MYHMRGSVIFDTRDSILFKSEVTPLFSLTSQKDEIEKVFWRIESFKYCYQYWFHESTCAEQINLFIFNLLRYNTIDTL